MKARKGLKDITILTTIQKKYGKKVSKKKLRARHDVLNNGLYRKIKNYVNCG